MLRKVLAVLAAIAVTTGLTMAVTSGCRAHTASGRDRERVDSRDAPRHPVLGFTHAPVQQPSTVTPTSIAVFARFAENGPNRSGRPEVSTSRTL